MFARFAHAVGNAVPNTKYTLLEMLKQHGKATASPAYQSLTLAKSHADVLDRLEALAGVPAAAAPYVHPHPRSKWVARPADLFAVRGKGKKGKIEAQLMKQ
jgi:hypothetical protein